MHCNTEIILFQFELSSVVDATIIYRNTIKCELFIAPGMNMLILNLNLDNYIALSLSQTQNI
jgi:hypothetical protein